ncbi:host attachment protein [Ruixingdingia sedimenti]|uniref:Host attachment protein n=1 Tax=Ruixingdingia sedimenti TaxID=3073604 RepID=A0ABU1F5A5_9RHOB|nr:host attachment protein [Xinfangfangia sp. LG-4]MDR5652057.1 host attachment protein [Xinfangfangia sp. LG-4]
MQRKRTLVVIANEKAARILANEGVGKGLAVCADLDATDYGDTDQSVTDRAGRGATPFGHGRHAMDDTRQTERDQERVAFAAHVMTAAETEWEKGYDRLVIAAGPKMLGELRTRLPAAMQDRLAADLPKDLVKIPVQDLPAHFADLIVL